MYSKARPPTTGDPSNSRFTTAASSASTSGGDGESLTLDEEPWVDPFLGVLSPENAEFVASSGKRTRFDLSTIEPYAHLIGGRVSDFLPVPGRGEK